MMGLIASSSTTLVLDIHERREAAELKMHKSKCAPLMDRLYRYQAVAQDSAFNDSAASSSYSVNTEYEHGQDHDPTIVSSTDLMMKTAAEAESFDMKDGPEMGRSQGELQIPIYSPVELLDHTDLSLSAILKGKAGNPLTPFEKKAALINVEMDNFGLGRYQICIWFLCGFGYFLDLAWAQGVGLIATAIYQEMGVADADYGNIYALANAGLAIGALGFGLAVDIIGRKWAFNLTCLITSVFGLLLVRYSTHPTVT